MSNTLEATRSLPDAPEMEELVLAGVFLDPLSIETCIEHGLDPNCFTIEKHRKVYEAMLALRESNTQINPLAVNRWLVDRRMSEGVDASWLVGLECGCLSTSQIPDAAKTVREKAISRQLIVNGNKIANLGYDQSKPLSDRKDAAEALLMQIGEERQIGEIHAPDITNSFEANFFQEMKASESFYRVPTHIDSLDAQLVGGIARSELTIITGRPSMGKSLVALAIAKNIALQGGGGVLFFTLEMSTKAIFERLLASQVGIDSKLIQQPWKLKGQDQIIDRIKREFDLLRTMPLTVYEDPRQSMAMIRSRSRREAARLQREGRSFDAIVVDHIGLMDEIATAEDTGNTSAVVGITGAVTNSLRNLAKELDVPVLGLAQLTRGPEQRNDKRPILSDLRGSGRFEENIDAALGVYRPEYYYKDDPSVKGILELIGLKGRSTGISTSVMGIDLPTYRLLPCPANDYRR